MDRIVEVPSIISLLEDNTLSSDIQVDENTTIIFKLLKIVSTTNFLYLLLM